MASNTVEKSKSLTAYSRPLFQGKPRRGRSGLETGFKGGVSIRPITTPASITEIRRPTGTSVQTTWPLILPFFRISLAQTEVRKLESSVGRRVTHAINGDRRESKTHGVTRTFKGQLEINRFLSPYCYNQALRYMLQPANRPIT